MRPVLKQPLSAAFAHRELNGEILLEELGELRAEHVRQSQLNDCALMLRRLTGQGAAAAKREAHQLVKTRLSDVPALARLVARWTERLHTDLDVTELVSHIQRLALTSALAGALRRGAERLRAGPLS